MWLYLALGLSVAVVMLILFVIAKEPPDRQWR